MRDIKFRGKRVNSGEWVYGDLQIQAKPLASILEYEQCCGYGNPVPVITETVGQYTGIKDKNGVEIYEGDILHDGFGMGAVWWITEHCAFIVKAIGGGKVTSFHSLESDGALIRTAIIGNIHTNPELLKKD